MKEGGKRHGMLVFEVLSVLVLLVIGEGLGVCVMI